MSRLLLRTLQNTCMSLTTECFNAIVFHSIKRFNSYVHQMQLLREKLGWTTDVIDFEKLGFDDQIFSIYEKYIQHVKPEFRNKVLENYLSLKVNNCDPYLISRDVAADFTALIRDDLLKDTSHVIELNPGFGLLTETLLQIGVPFINLYEKHVEFYSELHILNKKFPGRFSVRKANLFKLSKMINLNAVSIISACDMLNNVEQKKWEEDNCMQVIGTTNKKIFIRHLIMSTVFQTGFMSYGRPIFYLALSPSIWNTYISYNKVSTMSVMFNTLFNYKKFGILDRKAFVPWQKRKRNHSKIYHNSLSQEDNLLFVIKLEPKPDLFTIFNGKDDLTHFLHFVHYHLRKPTQRVIPAMEKLVADCGIRLIEKNYNIYTEFSRLNHNQILDLYTEFKAWPEFQHSTFLLSASFFKEMYEPFVEEK